MWTTASERMRTEEHSLPTFLMTLSLLVVFAFFGVGRAHVYLLRLFVEAVSYHVGGIVLWSHRVTLRLGSVYHEIVLLRRGL